MQTWPQGLGVQAFARTVRKILVRLQLLHGELLQDLLSPVQPQPE